MINVGATFCFALAIGPSDDVVLPLLEFATVIACCTLVAALFTLMRGKVRTAGAIVIGLVVAACVYVVALGYLLSQLS